MGEWRGFRILGPSRARGTPVAAQSHTPGLRCAGVRCMSGRAPQHFCDSLRCVAEPLHTAHAWQSQMDSYQDTDSAREQLTIWRQTTRVTRTHPDTRVHREDPSGHLPLRAHIRHPRGAADPNGAAGHAQPGIGRRAAAEEPARHPLAGGPGPTGCRVAAEVGHRLAQAGGNARVGDRPTDLHL